MKTMKRLLATSAMRKKEILIGLVCLLISTIATLTGPLVAKYMIDNVITPMGQSHVFDTGSVLLWVGILRGGKLSGSRWWIFKPFIYEDSLEPRWPNAFVTKCSSMYNLAGIVFRPFACRESGF